MQMVRIGKVRVGMLNLRVQVAMGVAGSGRHRARVSMVVVLVLFSMNMLVCMLKRFVQVTMFMLLGQMQPDPDSHQQSGGQQWRRDRFV